MHSLADALKLNLALKTLDVSYNPFSARTKTVLEDALTMNASILFVNMEDNFTEWYKGYLHIRTLAHAQYTPCCALLVFDFAHV